VSGWRFLALLIVPLGVVGACAVILRLGVKNEVEMIGCFAVLALGIAAQRKLLKGAKSDWWRWWLWRRRRPACTRAGRRGGG
jgi:hypothetical protein